MVDDFEPWRHFVRSILVLSPNLQIIDVASDGLEAVQKAEEQQPELIMLEINLPKLSGIEAARQIRKVAPESKMVFLSRDADPEVVRTAFRVGARGYVLKDDIVRDLTTAVESVIRGKRFVSHGVTAWDCSDTTEP